MIALDMHLHSIFSDGTNTPEEIVKIAKERNVNTIALTDHNTFAGIPDFKKACEKYKVNGVAGIEISSMYDFHGRDVEVHVLGYYPLDTDLYDLSFFHLQSYLKKYKNNKQIQNEAIITKLSKDFPQITVEGFRKYIGDINPNNANRVYIANYMVKEGLCQEAQEAFDKYIGTDKEYYVTKDVISTKDAISLIHGSIGIAIIAHIGEYKMQLSDANIFIKEMIDIDADGFEKYHPSNILVLRNAIQAAADTYNLITTAGSDFHGANKRQNIGDVLGEQFILTDKEQKDLEKMCEYFNKKRVD